jgi:hypothetical protein
MKHPHPEILEAYAADTSVEIEGQRPNGVAWLKAVLQDVLNPSYCDWQFRIKPERLSIMGLDGVERSFPEPMRVAPEKGGIYFSPWSGGIHEFTWNGQCFDQVSLKAGYIQATKAGAIEQRAAIVGALGGVE